MPVNRAMDFSTNPYMGWGRTLRSRQKMAQTYAGIRSMFPQFARPEDLDNDIARAAQGLIPAPAGGSAPRGDAAIRPKPYRGPKYSPEQAQPPGQDQTPEYFPNPGLEQTPPTAPRPRTYTRPQPPEGGAAQTPPTAPRPRTYSPEAPRESNPGRGVPSPEASARRFALRR